MTISLMIALLLSVIDQAIFKINPTQQAQAQISTTLAAITTTTTTNTTSLTTSCQKLTVAGAIAGGNGSMAPNVLDNNLNTAWSIDALGSWIQVNLGGEKSICSLDLAWYHGDQVRYNFIISVSNDDTTFTNVFTGKSSGTTLSSETYFLEGGIAGRYVRITVNGNSNNNNNIDNTVGITELRVYGFSTTNAPSLAPTADDKNVQTKAGTPVQITLTGSDPISVGALKFSVVSLPQHGSLAQGTMSNSVIWTPNIGFTGTDSFRYKATNDQGADSNPATTIINVNGISSLSTTTSPVAANGETIQIQTTSSSGPILGNSVPGDPASARDSDGRLEAFVVQSDNALYHKSETSAGSSSSWTSYSSLGGFVIAHPVVAQNSDGRLEVFVIGSNHSLYHESQITAGSSSWSGFTSLGGNFIGYPAAARNHDGRLEVFVIGADHALYHNFQTTAGSTTSWSGFVKLGGYIISNPVVGQNSDGRLEVFVIGSNHALYHIFQLAASSSSSWSGFASLGGFIISDPAVASNSDGRLEAFVVGSDHRLYHIFQLAASSSSSWSGFPTLGGFIISDPAVASNSDGRLEVFVIGNDNALWHISEMAASSSNSWSGFGSLGGKIISSSSSTLDKFGIKELYPTKANAEQWFINMQNPTSDPQFNPNGQTLTRNSDGSYKVQSSEVRLQAFTSSGYHQNLITTYNQQELAQKGYMQSPNDWKNVEITGYMKVNHFTTSTTNGAAHIALSARGGIHSSSVPCEGTAYWVATYEAGKVKLQKELEHTAGYTTNNPEISGATATLQGKWIGVKAVYYTFQNGSVKLEQWLDELTNNNWRKVIESKDVGNWAGGANDCGGTLTTIITWGGPIVQFRWDNIDDMDIKDLSVREIQPPQ